MKWLFFSVAALTAIATVVVLWVLAIDVYRLRGAEQAEDWITGAAFAAFIVAAMLAVGGVAIGDMEDK